MSRSVFFTNKRFLNILELTDIAIKLLQYLWAAVLGFGAQKNVVNLMCRSQIVTRGTQ